MKNVIIANGPCVDCEKNKFPKNKEKIGIPVHHQTKLGKGYDQSTYEFFQCIDCGAIWQTITDKGAGGHGFYTSKLTK